MTLLNKILDYRWISVLKGDIWLLGYGPNEIDSFLCMRISGIPKQINNLELEQISITVVE